ncbi:MAG: polysaccharide pyruvyl transferase family protein [Vicinamibacterales bacterium]
MIHHVFACKSNIGDWLSALAIQKLLSPAPVVEHLCDEPYRAATLERLSRLSPGDTIVIGGGGLLMDYFDPFWKRMPGIAEATPTMIWGVGLCDHVQAASQPDINLLRPVFSAAKLAVVRDELTMTFLQGLAEGPVACPAMSLFSSDSRNGHGALHVHHRGVITRHRYETVVATVTRFAAETGRAYVEINNRIGDGKRQQLDATVQRYREADVVVSSRLHGCIIGLAMGKKVVALSGDRKVESFMKAAGLEPWIWRDEAPQSLAELLSEAPRQQDASAFVAQAAVRNEAVAARVLHLAGERRVAPPTTSGPA